MECERDRGEKRRAVKELVRRCKIDILRIQAKCEEDGVRVIDYSRE